MLFEHDSASVLERLCESLEAHRSRPRAILGCSYPFEGSIFGEILDCIADALQIDCANLKHSDRYENYTEDIPQTRGIAFICTRIQNFFIQSF